jgi:glutathione S-transferase
MKLFYTKRSPYARKVRIIALEKNIPLELIEEDLTKKSDTLQQVNPLGKIPALLLDNGQVLVDSPVICEYLDTQNDKVVFIPKSGEKRFYLLHLAAIADGLMDNTVSLYMEKVRHPQNFNAAFVQNQEAAISKTLAFFDNHVKDIAGLNIASIGVASALGYILFRLPQFYLEKEIPHLDQWYKDFSTRPSLVQTVPVG